MSEYQVICGVCSKKRTTLPETIGWCVKCQIFLCSKCWKVKNDKRCCPKCESELRSMDEGELIQLLKDNPSVRRSLYIERACIPWIG